MKFQLTRAAVSDLAQIGRYGRSNWGEAQAKKYREALKARFHWLARNRSLWRARDDLGPRTFSCVEGRHVILFREDAGSLQILRVLHGQMDPKRHLADD